MRYTKGTFQLNAPRDTALLRHVLHNRIVSRGQLFQLLVLTLCENSPKSFAWRIGRLVQHGLLQEHAVPLSRPDNRVYTITEIGMANLERNGEYFSWVEPVTPAELEHANVTHTLEVSNVQIALQRAGLLVRWISGHRLRVAYDNGSTEYVKVYDAVAEIRMGQGTKKIGIEYERTQKRIENYLDIGNKLANECNLDAILYLIPTHELIANVSQHFHTGRLNVLFCFIEEFKRDLLNSSVYTAKQISRVRLIDVLTRQSEPASLFSPLLNISP